MPVRTTRGLSRISVKYPTLTPATSVMALRSPVGNVPTAIPRSRSRTRPMMLPCQAPAASRGCRPPSHMTAPEYGNQTYARRPVETRHAKRSLDRGLGKGRAPACGRLRLRSPRTEAELVQCLPAGTLPKRMRLPGKAFMEDVMPDKYVDAYVMPVPKSKVDSYKAFSKRIGD